MSIHPPSPPLDPAFAAAFLRVAGPARTLRFDVFMALALYDPTFGYYRRDKTRVGRERGADFYTATSLGPLFGELVAAAAAKLLREVGLDLAAHAFVELGAEPSGGVLSGVAGHPFASVRTLRVGEPLTLDGPCVVFSNELFDAQPVRRFVRRAEAWHELGVALSADDSSLSETDLGPVAADAELFLPPLAITPEGYLFDAPRAAAELAAALATQPWHGLFIAFDYGKSFAELGHAVPAGTVRAYFQHTQHNDLLARPGEQDLTAHVCWDWLADALRDAGCLAPEVLSQESFFVHHAGDFIAGELARESARPVVGAAGVSSRKRALMHLLHPGQMGQKFQVLLALKPETRPGSR
jgi:SAM-dependent MidA family methyltransferase